MVVAASRLTAAMPCLDRAKAPCHIAEVSRVMYMDAGTRCD